jgi:hypothetical protein
VTGGGSGGVEQANSGCQSAIAFRHQAGNMALSADPPSRAGSGVISTVDVRRIGRALCVAALRRPAQWRLGPGSGRHAQSQTCARRLTSIEWFDRPQRLLSAA